MDETRAFSIVSALANGVNPLTGEVFPADSPYQTAEVVRALFLVSRMLEARTKSRSRPDVPGNAGKPWTAEEDQRLLQEFDRGTVIAELARSHGTHNGWHSGAPGKARTNPGTSHCQQQWTMAVRSG